jgi:hypothetical protein
MVWLFPKMALVFRTLIAIGVPASVFCAGIYVNPVAFAPQTATVIEPSVECQLVERHTVQYVDRPVTVVNNIEQVQRIPVELRNFSDLEELRQWLAAVDTNTTTVYFQPPDASVDCDDYALDLQRKALADGYIMSFEVIGRSEYNAVFKSELPPSQSLHAINLAIIGNNAYYIEPQTGEVVFAAYLD